MMLEEFEKRTGYFPTMEEYAAIEKAYMEFSGDKDAFCKAYKKNEDGIAERIQREVNMQHINAQSEAEKAQKAMEERWYGKATSAEPDPYVYDGYMSPEDFELMHKNMEADRQREKSPPEGPTAELTLTFTPETAAALLEAITPPLLRAVQYAAEVARKAWDAFMEVIRKTVATVADLAGKFVDAMLCTANDHPKWWHYYKHAKKWRVRKKYRRRLERQLYDKLLAAASG